MALHRWSHRIAQDHHRPSAGALPGDHFQMDPMGLEQRMKKPEKNNEKDENIMTKPEQIIKQNLNVTNHEKTEKIEKPEKIMKKPETIMKHLKQNERT